MALRRGEAARRDLEERKDRLPDARAPEYVRQSPTTSDNVRQSHTMSDNVSESPTPHARADLVQTTVRLAAWQKQQLQELASRDGRLLSDVVREAVRDYLSARGI